MTKYLYKCHFEACTKYGCFGFTPQFGSKKGKTLRACYEHRAWAEERFEEAKKS